MIVDDSAAASAPHRPALQAQMAARQAGPWEAMRAPPRTVAGLTERERGMDLTELLEHVAGSPPIICPDCEHPMAEVHRPNIGHAWICQCGFQFRVRDGVPLFAPLYRRKGGRTIQVKTPSAREFKRRWFVMRQFHRRRLTEAVGPGDRTGRAVPHGIRDLGDVDSYRRYGVMAERRYRVSGFPLLTGRRHGLTRIDTDEC